MMNPRTELARRRASALVIACAAAIAPAICAAQDYPSRPIRIVTGSIGGGTDFTSRVIAQEITAPLAQQVVVDNRPGGTLGSEIVSKSPPDGYTVLLTANLHWISPLFGKSPYDPLRDFSPITMVSSSPNILVVHPSLPVKTVKELIALAKAKPGGLNYASTGPASGSHLAGELFKYMAGIDMVHVPYKGGGPAVIALRGGQVQLMFNSAPALTPSIKAGKLRAIAIGSAQPSALMPGLPTIAASGLPGYESVQIYAMFAPAKTPGPIIARIHDEVVKAIARPEVKEKFLTDGAETIGSTPERLASSVAAEIARLGKVIKAAHIQLLQ